MTQSTVIKSSTLQSSYAILDSLRLSHGLYLASPSEHYSYVWIRDSVYMSLPYLDKPCDTYERTYWRLLDLMKEYEWKIDIHTIQRPVHQHEYIHSRFTAEDVKEIPEPWGHAQHDAIGALLWGIGQGERSGKSIIRDEADKRVVQKIVDYLICCEYWHDPDNGMWEEDREVHLSSIAACYAGLRAVKELVKVPISVVITGAHALSNLAPRESSSKMVDLAQLSLIYPYYSPFVDKRGIVERVESRLLRRNGVIRYEGDSYYSTLRDDREKPREAYYGTEAEWTMGLPWLALCHLELGNVEKAREYVEWTERVMLPGAVLPELYYAGTHEPGPNTPLGWSSAMYILAKEALEK